MAPEAPTARENSSCSSTLLPRIPDVDCGNRIRARAVHCSGDGEYKAMSVTTSAAARFLNQPRTPNRLASTGFLSFPHRQFLRILSYSLLPFASSSFTTSSQKILSPLPGVWSLHRMEDLCTTASPERNKDLIEHLRYYGAIKSKTVAAVMETIDRGLFVPDCNPPYSDSPMPIGYNATISAPHMHATCLELLKDHLMPGMRALDVGSGTGYLTACFAMMVGLEGHAAGVEHIPELVAMSVENINRSAAASLMEGGSLSLHVSDGRLGWPELAPFDAIHVGAAAPEIPKALVDQLKPGGRMVIPIGNIFQDLKVVDKNLNGSVTMQTDTSVRYVPLTSRAAQLQEF